MKIFGLRDKLWKGAAYALLFALSVGVSCAVTIAFLVRRADEVVVPDLASKSESEAKLLLSQVGLVMKIVGESPSDSLASGSVLSQLVAPGEEVRAGRIIGVFLSKGARERTAPRVIAMEDAAARSILHSTGFRVVEAGTTCSDPYPRGYVAAQSPPPGEITLRPEVALLLSDGPCLSRYVSLIEAKMTLRDVSEALDHYRFVSRTVSRRSVADVDPGIIVEVYPPRGSILSPEDLIQLGVSDSAMTRAWGDGRLAYIPLRRPPGLFRGMMRLIVERTGTPLDEKMSVEFAGSEESPDAVALWVFEGSRASVEIDGRQIWRKIF